MEARVVLYSRTGCHLCADARELVGAVCEPSQVTWQEVLIDSEPALIEKYGDEVPVVTVDGAVVGFWHIDADLLRRAVS